MEEALYDMVEAYLQNELSESDRKAFEARLKSEPQFRDTVKPLMLAGLSARIGREEDLRQRMSKWMEDIKQDPPKSKVVSMIRPLYVGLAIAAAIALVLLIVLPRFNTSEDFNGERLFAENFEPYLPPETRSSALTLDSALQMAHVAILEGNYDEGIAQLEAVVDTTALPAAVLQKELLYLGSAYLQAGQAEKALETFQIINYPQSTEVRWYTALTYLRLGDKESTMTLLKALASSNDYYGKAAKKLLEDL